MKRAGELVQLVKRLPCKHEDLHLDPQHPCKSQAHPILTLRPLHAHMCTHTMIRAHLKEHVYVPHTELHAEQNYTFSQSFQISDENGTEDHVK